MGAPDPNPSLKPSPASEREARLAKALRENLRRRKAAPPPLEPAAEGAPKGR